MGELDYIHEGIRHLAVDINELVPDENNAVDHNKASVDAIANSLDRFGQDQPLVVQSDTMVVRKGNGRLLGARQLGWTHLACVVVEEDDISSISRAIADNKSGEFRVWNKDRLADLLRDVQSGGEDVLRLGWSSSELEKLIGTDPKSDVGPQLDKCEELKGRWGTSLGQVWEATSEGRTHRVMCGDSEKAADVAKLLAGQVPFIMVTDPPYGVEYDPTYRSENRTGAVANDDRFDWTETYKLFEGDVAYVWHAGKFCGDVALNLSIAEFKIRNQIIWRKPKFVMGRGSYHWQHEPCWYAVRKGRPARWCGDRTQSTIWEIDHLHPILGSKDEDTETVHGTQKPLECMERPIRNHGQPGDLVYDPFLGSGTTLIAAERAKRNCCGMELKPAYVAVILQRMKDFGLDPILLSR